MDLVPTLTNLITVVTPVLVPVIVMWLKGLPLPKYAWPVLAILLGAVADVMNELITGGGVGVVWGGVLGGLGVAVREIKDQLQKSMATI